MSFQPRPYQQEAIQAGLEFLRTAKPDEGGLLVEPTGSGKSIVIAGIVTQLDGPAIVFQPSKEILEQNLSKFRAYGHNPGVFSASAGQKRIRKITLAIIGSVHNKPHLFNEFKYVIVDEAHLVNPKPKKRGGEIVSQSMFANFFDGLGDVRIIGLTATPYRLAHNSLGSVLRFLTRTRPRLFTKLVHVTQNQQLVRDGYWAALDYKQVKTGFREDRLRLNSTGADYTDESVRQHFRELNFSDQIVRCVNRVHELGRRGTLVFTRFVEEARYVASRIPGAEIVTAETHKDERQRIIRGFKAGEIPVVANVNVLAIGFDYPELANVVLAQPTRSLARYYQQVGRVVRPHPSKQSAFVIDMVGLVEKFGKVEDFVLKCGPHDTWFLEANGRQLTNVYFGQPVHQIGVGQVAPMPMPVASQLQIA